MTPLAQKAQLALEGSIRGPEAVRCIIDYVEDLFSRFDPNDITDEQIDLVVFLSRLRDAIDPDGGSPLRLDFTPRGPGRPASPAAQRARQGQARLAAYLADRWREKGQLAKQANSKAAELMNVSVSEIYEARKTQAHSYRGEAMKKVRPRK